MNFRTQIPIRKYSVSEISYASKLLLLGSCFSDNIGNRLSYYKFDVTVNPFGVLFHPIAIEKFFENCVKQSLFTEDHIFFHNERWHCFDAHSVLSSVSKSQLLSSLNQSVKKTHIDLKDTSHVVITLGTSWVYFLNENKQVVANCHKISQNKFTKKILSINQIVASLKNIIELIQSIKKEITIIFTVSPVRHIKDGFTENMLSKSHLIAAIHQVLDNQAVFYFPSYEIMMDELRDYRFYTEDMIHPNTTAINFIWNKFVESWFDESEKKVRANIDNIQKSLAHKPFNPSSEEHQRFLKKLQQKIEKIKEAYPRINF